jgi:hypothetical protein
MAKKTSNFFEQANQKKLFELSCDILNIKQVSIFKNIFVTDAEPK